MIQLLRVFSIPVVLLALTSPAWGLNSLFRVEVAGILTDAENLTFSVINGNPLSQNPEQSDLPLNFDGLLTVDTALNTASFEFGGSFTSPSRSYNFDIVTPNVGAGITILDLMSGLATIEDVFDDFDFSLTLASTGVGTFRFLNPGVVPTDPAQNVFAEGIIQNATVLPVIPEPTSLAMLGLLFGAVACRSRSGR